MPPRPEPLATERQGPGRPSTGARERILAAGLEVLAREGYAGLTTAKVAARSGQNKALISYHFGSKDGLVKAVGLEVGHAITVEVVEELGRPGTVEELVRGVLDGLWRVMDRDARLARLYFDLAAVSVVEPQVRIAMQEIKAGFRYVLMELLLATSDAPPKRGAEAAAVYVIAGVEGLALERLDRGETPALRRAMAMFVSSAPAALSAAAA